MRRMQGGTIVGRRSWPPIAQVALVGVLMALAFPADGSAYLASVSIALSATGPSPAAATMFPGYLVTFTNSDTVAHKVVFADGGCSLDVPPGPQTQTRSGVNACPWLSPEYVGVYDYTVDGTYSGRLTVSPLTRAVTLTARTHRVPADGLMLHGQVTFGNAIYGPADSPYVAPFPVIVLSRRGRTSPYTRLATIDVHRDKHSDTYRWRLKVRPTKRTTYTAEANGQLRGGTIWKQAKSSPFTVLARR
jgi:plastocyanin